MLVFKSLSFSFIVKRNPYTAHNVGKTLHCKTEMVSENIITDTVKITCKNFNSLKFQQLSIFMVFHEYI